MLKLHISRLRVSYARKDFLGLSPRTRSSGEGSKMMLCGLALIWRNMVFAPGGTA